MEIVKYQRIFDRDELLYNSHQIIGVINAYGRDCDLLHCINCGGALSISYGYILDQLNDAGLLPKKFLEEEVLCCLCWSMRNQEHIRKNWDV